MNYSLNANEALDGVKFIKERAKEAVEAVSFATKKVAEIADTCNIPFIDEINSRMEACKKVADQTVEAAEQVERGVVSYAEKFSDFGSARGL